MGGMRERVLVAIAAALIAAALSTSTAYASCVPTTVPEQRARADLIFDGIALEGPTATGVQRFRVTRYVKGGGPRVVRVSTGTVRRADGSGNITSVSLVVKRGERWRIFAEGSARNVVRTSVCAGSRER